MTKFIRGTIEEDEQPLNYCDWCYWAWDDHTPFCRDDRPPLGWGDERGEGKPWDGKFTPIPTTYWNPFDHEAGMSE